MTKINKLGKSTFVIAILSFILVAVLAFGGTYAYFSATSNTAKGNVNLGHLRIVKDSAKFDSANLVTGATIVVPNQTILNSTGAANGAENGNMQVTVDSNINYFIRANIQYSVELVNIATKVTTPDNPETDENELVTEQVHCKDGGCGCTDAALKQVLIITPGVAAETDGEATEAGWIASTVSGEMDQNGVQGTGWYYFNQVISHDNPQAGADTNTKTHNFAITARVNPQVGQVESEHFMDAVITITVVFEVIQADYIITDAAADPAELYDAATLSAAWAKADAPFVNPTPEG